jgi:RNA polymerase sigma-54 factor
MPSQTLSLSQGQHLQMILAPQLRQSLEMLQLPILELRTMIQSELEQNPTIEEKPIEGQKAEIEPGDGKPETPEEMQFKEEFEVLSKLDDEWRDYFFQEFEAQPYSEDDEERHQFMLDSIPHNESLQEHLLAQLHIAELSDQDRRVGELIIGSINNDGYLTTPLPELAVSANCDPQHLQDILSVVQDFHPTGVGARDLSECLLIQLERLGKSDTLAALIVRTQLDNLAERRYAEIAKALKVGGDEVRKAAHLISTLDPKPGRVYSDEVSAYILPEVVVQQVDGKYVVILNDDQLPHVRISQQYREMLQSEDTPPHVKQYIRERIRSGAFLIKSIHQRQRTIHKIAGEIVERQQEFLRHGISRLKPLTMAEVAGTVGVHETTVSRAVSGKYMKTPLGIFEMKYFFTPGIKTAGGSEVSNMTVKDMIAGMVAKEDPDRPLSDQEIVEELQRQGLQIARRTIAKYRLALRIAPSHMRKRY